MGGYAHTAETHARSNWLRRPLSLSLTRYELTATQTSSSSGNAHLRSLERESAGDHGAYGECLLRLCPCGEREREPVGGTADKSLIYDGGMSVFDGFCLRSPSLYDSTSAAASLVCFAMDR